MKNNEIRKALENMVPSLEEKEEILNHILKEKEKRNPSFRWLWVPCFLWIISINLLGIFNNEKNATTYIKFRMEEKIIFVYNGKCYEESDESLKEPLKQIGITSEIENKTFKRIPIYKDQAGHIGLSLKTMTVSLKEVHCFQKKERMK